MSSSALAGDFPAPIEAVRDNNLEKVTKLLDQGADVNTVDSRGMSALVHAVTIVGHECGI
ncbi:MAG: hypothetical protein E2O38_05915 [Proteobacteria bacterium]|nr:MAG: hypothetical protein E2O38_05915 [Pseudomonadota bacterium]